MWAVALIFIIDGVAHVTPGQVRLYSKSDCDRFGEIWEEVYKRQGGQGETDHICTELEIPGVDI